MPCGACGCACSEASMSSREAPLLLIDDIENPTAVPPEAEVNEPTDAATEKGDMIPGCIARGLLTLLWLYLVDLMRRNMPADDDDYHIINVFFVVIIAAVVGAFFCEIGANLPTPSTDDG